MPSYRARTRNRKSRRSTAASCPYRKSNYMGSPNVPMAIAAQRSLTRGKRTLLGHRQIDAFDPNPTSALFAKALDRPANRRVLHRDITSQSLPAKVVIVSGNRVPAGNRRTLERREASRGSPLHSTLRGPTARDHQQHSDGTGAARPASAGASELVPIV
jgi:hypothetical protein